MKHTKIKSIKKSRNYMYDITVNKNHNLFINKHLIHNCNYRGEIKVILYNTSKEDFTVEKGMRIAQMVITQLPRIDFVEVDTLGETSRGEGGFGSTGVK